MFTAEDTHMQTWHAENHESTSDQAWESWAAETALLFRQAGLCILSHEWHYGNTMPIDLDGDGRHSYPAGDGFSLDEAYEKWDAGGSPQAYLDLVLARRGDGQ